MTRFDLSSNERAELLAFVQDRLEAYYSATDRFRVSPELAVEQIREFVGDQDFSEALPGKEALEHVFVGLEQYAVHTPHPKYFGLFNPRANFAGILADFISATYNPQMAAWSHSPFAVEAEAHMIREFGQLFGYSPHSIDGVFAAGGAEANLTAVLCALNRHFPTMANEGLRSLDKQPRIYCSSEAHHSVVKAARNVGLGYHAVVNIAVDESLRMDANQLREQLKEDIEKGFAPFMLVGTAGTTGAGSVDPLETLSDIAKEFQLWYHVDAAYGGAAVIHPELKRYLQGIEHSDSITFDAHKWLSVPMATSLFVTRDPTILDQTFRTTTDYMPKDANTLHVTDPFTHSIQWSRRFIGLKLYLSLLFFGWDGYAEAIDHQHRMGELLEKELTASGWVIKSSSPFPISCFTDPDLQDDPDFVPTLAQAVVDSGKSWVSVYPVDGLSTIRACITNYATQAEDILALVKEVNTKRKLYSSRQ